MDEAPPDQHAARVEIWRAVRLALKGLPYLLGAGTFFLGGRFVSHEPADRADLIFVPKDWDDAIIHVHTDPRVLAWTTLVGVAIWRPFSTSADRIHSVGGLVDTRLWRREHLAQAHTLLARRRDEAGKIVDSKEIGYLEVRP